jgi:DNA mismatch repair protein MutL
VHALVLAVAREALQRMGRPGRTPATDPRPAPERQAERIGEETEAHPAFALPLRGASPGVAESATPSGASFPAGGGFRDNRPLAGRAPAQEKIWTERPLEALRVIGQFQSTYLICEAPGDLVLIDQHAAHERIIYERLQSAHQGSGGQRQALLLPETVELNHREAARIEELMPELERLGLELEPFGGGTFAVKAVPAPLAGGEVAPLVMQIAEKALDSHAEGGLERAIQESLVLMACHGAIRAHQALSPAEATALLRQLEACATPSCCPHGRPTLIRWPLAALEKMFKRIA